MCGVVVGLACNHSKVKKACDTSQSGTETPQKPSEVPYTRFMETGETQDFQNLKNLTFSFFWVF